MAGVYTESCGMSSMKHELDMPYGTGGAFVICQEFFQGNKSLSVITSVIS